MKVVISHFFTCCIFIEERKLY